MTLDSMYNSKSTVQHGILLIARVSAQEMLALITEEL